MERKKKKSDRIHGAVRADWKMWRKKNPEIWVVFSVISSHLYPLRPTNILCNSILSQFMYFLCNVLWIPIMFLPFFPCSFCLTAEWSLSNNYSTSMSKPLVSFVIIFLRQFFVVFCVFFFQMPSNSNALSHAVTLCTNLNSLSQIFSTFTVLLKN